MKIATWNVNGIRARETQLLEWLAEEQPDVLCLQEIKAKPEQVPASLCALSGYSCYWHGAGGYSGVALHVRAEAFSEPPEFTHPHFDNETRIVQARIGNLVIASVYIPNGGKDFEAKLAFMREMEQYAAKMKGEGVELVLCGDMNVARTDIDVHPKERKPNAIGQLPVERELFEQLIGNDLVDVGRAMDPENENLFTWWAPWRNMRQRNIGWRIDYILASQSLARRATASYVRPTVGTSDHAPLVAVFE
jgi:exodeoxyribonuclease-3